MLMVPLSGCKSGQENNLGIENNVAGSMVQSDDKTVEASTVNNGGYYVQYNGYTYYREYTKDSVEEYTWNTNLGIDYGDKPAVKKMMRIDQSGNKEYLFDDEGCGEIFIYNDRMYLKSLTSDYGYKCYSVDLKGNDKKDCADGLNILSDIDEQNGRLFFRNGILNLNSGQAVKFDKEDASFCGYDPESRTAYFQYDFNAENVKINSLSYDGETSKFFADTPRYENMSSSPVTINEIQIKNDYLYFSYGSYEGTGNYYNNGTIARVKKDGSGFKILAQNNEANETTDATFVVLDTNKGESVVFSKTNTKENSTEQKRYILSLSDFQTAETNDYFPAKIGTPFNEGREWSIYINDKGEKVKLITEDDIKNIGKDVYFDTEGDTGYREINHVGYLNHWVYFVLEEAERSEENDIGWRPAYKRKISEVYRKSLETSKIELLYSY